jgi:hypothetical protein
MHTCTQAVAGHAAPLKVVLARFVRKYMKQSSSFPGELNTITLTLATNIPLLEECFSAITITNLASVDGTLVLQTLPGSEAYRCVCVFFLGMCMYVYIVYVDNECFYAITITNLATADGTLVLQTMPGSEAYRCVYGMFLCLCMWDIFVYVFMYVYVSFRVQNRCGFVCVCVYIYIYIYM